jgi:GNAT superfamily N-acetyltransferase
VWYDKKKKGKHYMRTEYIVDKEIMNRWDYLIDKKIYFDNFYVSYRKTERAICQSIFFEEKKIGCLYIFGLKKMDDNFIHGYSRRVYIKPEFRGKGFVHYMLENFVKNFGECVLHISSVSPNRVKGLNDENRERYRNILYNIYGKAGFIKNAKGTGMMRFPV